MIDQEEQFVQLLSDAIDDDSSLVQPINLEQYERSAQLQRRIKAAKERIKASGGKND